MSWGHFLDYLQGPGPRVVFWLALAAALVTISVFAIGKIRQGFRESGADASNLITNFRDLHSQGELSDEEYRTIRARLAERLQRQLERPDVKLERPGQDAEHDG
jgi:hypothetical protein